MLGALRIGTSGWHYPTGAGTWNGVFYPKPRPKGFDELAFYSQYFNTVELNTTFYGQPKAEISADWVRRTPADFEFAVKLYQQFTHPRLYRARVQQTLKRALGPVDLPEDAVAALTAANQADIDAFRRGIDPLGAGGKLGPLLAQFPASFRDTPENRVHLASLMRAFQGYDLAVELRHRTWTDRRSDTQALLDAFGATWAWIDEPKFKDSVQQPEMPRVPFAYLRMHGRNAAAWWQSGERDARYDYQYSVEELRTLATQLAAGDTRRPTRVYFNNHPSARAIVNAGTMAALAGSPIARAFPATLQQRYPEVVIRPVSVPVRS